MAEEKKNTDDDTDTATFIETCQNKIFKMTQTLNEKPVTTGPYFERMNENLTMFQHEPIPVASTK